ncbi:hypothetical protein MiAbB_04859 [Microcystis aeruginosa NIES-4285]|uniref:Glycosyl transferase family 1 domain-containing protein n=1 Tax=Microcystis aeruginosa NIES-4285 TaxID=2497681 RepID=A0A402DL29_MICAE|nr:hypothetical protein MiAbB_04859 [Microcystis aeruginosa NIES-4285]
MAEAASVGLPVYISTGVDIYPFFKNERERLIFDISTEQDIEKALSTLDKISDDDLQYGQMLLTICLSTMNLTTGVVKSALEAISFADVKEWLVEVFGQSMLSKRKTLFSANIDDTETA